MERPTTSRGDNEGYLRPTTGSSLRPITGQRTPGTATRINTGLRTPATPGQLPGYGISLNTEVQVQDRPVTQQGMMGMRVGTSSGPRRQVQDTSYFVGKLHQKINEITSEMNKLQAEIEMDGKERSQFSTYERQYETLINEVRGLEGQLADYNLALDKLRSSTDPKEVLDIQSQLKSRNKKQSEEIDQIFLQRQEYEKQIKQMEASINKFYKAQEERINQLAPSKVAEYHELTKTNDKLQEQLHSQTQEYDKLVNIVRMKEKEIQNIPYRVEYQHLTEEYISLLKEIELLEEDTKTLKLPPNEAREIMLSKVKERKKQLETIEKEVNEKEMMNKELKKQIAEIQEEYNERAKELLQDSSSEKENQYDKLRQRDLEMTEFLAQYPSLMETREKEMNENETMILRLLQHISSIIQRDLPNNTQFNELKNDLSFKERQLQTNQYTKEKLEYELIKYQNELEKINTLEMKIKVELNTLKEKQIIMENDLIEFNKMNEMKGKHEEIKRQLISLRESYSKRYENIKLQIYSLTNRLNEKKNERKEMEIYQVLEKLIEKLKYNEESIYTIKQFVDGKNREIDYSMIKEECLKILDEINTILITNQSMKNIRKIGAKP